MNVKVTTALCLFVITSITAHAESPNESWWKNPDAGDEVEYKIADFIDHHLPGLSRFGTCQNCIDFSRDTLRPRRGPSGGCKIEQPKMDHVLRNLIAKRMPSWKKDKSSTQAPSVAIYLVDHKGKTRQTLFEQNAHHQQPVASTQKILTAFLAYKARCKDGTRFWDKKLSWTANDAYQAESTPALHLNPAFKIFPHEEVSVPVMTHTLLRQSSNIAANALARKYQECTGQNLVEQMNWLTQYEILTGLHPGLVRTHFTDASGLRDDQGSTPHNMAKIMAYVGSDTGFTSALRDIKESYRGKTYSQNLTHFWGGPDHLFKPGFTTQAGITQVASFPIQNCGPGYRIVIASFGRGPQAMPRIRGHNQVAQFQQFNHELKRLVEPQSAVAGLY